MSGTAGSEPESNSEPLPEPESASESIPEIEPTPHAESESTSFLSEVESHSESTPKSYLEWNPNAINSSISTVLPEISAEPQAEASPVEIVVPPAVFVLCGFLGGLKVYLLVLYKKKTKQYLCNVLYDLLYNTQRTYNTNIFLVLSHQFKPVTGFDTVTITVVPFGISSELIFYYRDNTRNYICIDYCGLVYF